MGEFATRPLTDVMACMERVVDAERPFVQLALAMASLTVAWFVYVPIHELLHVAGCIATGGQVSELQIQPIYFGALLASIFDFVVVGGQYSGRLSGFDTGGSDLVYLATDLAPYLLSIFIGVPLMRACARSTRPLWLGPAVVVGFAPFYSLIGDYYEMGSIVVTRLASTLTGGTPLSFEALRSDDLLNLVATLVSAPGELGLTSSIDVGSAALIVTASALLGLALALATYWLGGVFSSRALGIEAIAPPAVAASEPSDARD